MFVRQNLNGCNDYQRALKSAEERDSNSTFLPLCRLIKSSSREDMIHIYDGGCVDSVEIYNWSSLLMYTWIHMNKSW